MQRAACDCSQSCDRRPRLGDEHCKIQRILGKYGDEPILEALTFLQNSGKYRKLLWVLPLRNIECVVIASNIQNASFWKICVRLDELNSLPICLHTTFKLLSPISPTDLGIS